MKFGPRIPSLKKRIAARTSPARFFRHSLGLALLLVALLASLALAGQSDVYGPQRQYQGRVVQNPGNPRQKDVYGPTGAYQGRIVERPGDTGQADVYGPTGDYQGTTREQPGQYRQEMQPDNKY